MAVFSNDPRIQRLWHEAENLRVLASTSCSPTSEIYKNTCTEEQMRRLGYAACTKKETVPNDCPDWTKKLKDAEANLRKAVNEDAKRKADADKKAADTAAEQAILNRRRNNDKTLSAAYIESCRQTIGVDNDTRAVLNPNYNAKTCADLDKKRVATNNFTSGQASVTFEEIEREKKSMNTPAGRKEGRPKGSKRAQGKKLGKPRGR